MIVAGAIASRDFMPVHHDRDYANKQGSPNLFMNILTTNGYCVRFLTDWAGPEAMVKKLSIRLGVLGFPDDPLRFTGRVTGKSKGSGGDDDCRELRRRGLPGSQQPGQPRVRHRGPEPARRSRRVSSSLPGGRGRSRDRPDRVLQGVRPERAPVGRRGSPSGH